MFSANIQENHEQKSLELAQRLNQKHGQGEKRGNQEPSNREGKPHAANNDTGT